MSDTKPIFKRINGTWVKQDAFQRISGAWVKISSKEEAVSGYTLTITNNTRQTISTDNIKSNNISSILPLESIPNGETKTFLITFTNEFPDGGTYPYGETYICFYGFSFYEDTGSTFSGNGISSVGSLVDAGPSIIFTNPVKFNGSGHVTFNGYDD